MKMPLLLLILASACLAYAPSQYVESGLDYTEYKLQTEDGYSTLIVIDETEMFVVDEKGKLVENPDEIYQLLRQNVRKSSGFSSTVESTKMILNRIDYKRAYAQVECYRYTGMDKFDCYDKDSCVLAAFSTPIASSAVNADGFWEYMRNYKTNNEKLQNKINELEIKLSNEAQKENSDAIIGIMNEITQLEYEIEENALFLTREDENCTGFEARHCYEFCPKLNWTHDKADFEVVLNTWSQVSYNLSKINEQDSRATQIYQNTQKWKEYLKDRGSILTAVKKNVSNTQSRIQNILMSPKYEKINDSQTTQKYVNWIVEVSNATELADSGQFYNGIKKLGQLNTQGEIIYFEIKGNVDKLDSFETKIGNIKEILEKTPTNNRTATTKERIESDFEQFNSSIEYPIPVQQLQTLDNTAKEIENDALRLYAKSDLNIEIEQPEANKSVDEPVVEPLKQKNILELILELIRRIFPIEI